MTGRARVVLWGGRSIDVQAGSARDRSRQEILEILVEISAAEDGSFEHRIGFPRELLPPADVKFQMVGDVTIKD